VNQDSFEEIDVDDLAERLGGGVLLIDVRETDEYVSGHVPGAVSIPLSELQTRVDECRDPRGEVSILICKAGGRSANACAYLTAHGLRVINVAGGTMAWMMSGRDVVEGTQP